MNILNLLYIFALLLGLGLFLLGIRKMSQSFKKDLTTTIKSKINHLSSSKLIAVISGIIITSIIQSSSATTLIIVGLVHGNVISLYNAVPIIMGANIGTTLTSQLVAFGLSTSPFNIALISLLLFLLLKKSKNKFLPNLLLGLSLMLLGLNTISIFVNKLRAVGVLAKLIAQITINPISGVFLGTLITSIIQSSSTGITILQILSSSGVISVWRCIPIILGQNIGTCTNTLIGSIATNKAGRQIAITHVLFNITGALMFVFFIRPLYNIIIQLSPHNTARQIAHAHTIFNVVTTLILLPFSNILVKMSKKIIRE